MDKWRWYYCTFFLFFIRIIQEYMLLYKKRIIAVVVVTIWKYDARRTWFLKLTEYEYLLLTFVVYDKTFISHFELLKFMSVNKRWCEEQRICYFWHVAKNQQIWLLMANNVVVRYKTIRKIKTTFVETRITSPWMNCISLLAWMIKK